MTPGVVPTLSFDVAATPRGDPRARHTRGGWVHRDKRADEWKVEVRAACLLALSRAGWRELVELGTPVGVVIVLRLPRPQKHYRRQKLESVLRDDAPVWCTSKPDGDNVEKAILDAVGAFDGAVRLVWSDDQQVVSVRWLKLYADDARDVGAHVLIHPVENMKQKHEQVLGPLLTPGDLTPGEALELSRRRSGASQADVAAVLGVGVNRYREWELDERPGPLLQLSGLTLPEQCYVLRRREGWTLQDLAGRMRMTRFWLSRAECGTVAVDLLVDFWTRRRSGAEHYRD